MKKLVLSISIAFFAAALFAYDIGTSYPMKGSARKVTKTNYSVVSKFGEYFRVPSNKIVTLYDESGRVIEIDELTARDVVVNRVVNSYDASGKLTVQIGYDDSNIQIWKGVSVFKNGQKVETSEYGKDSSLKSKIMYTYTGGRLADETYYNGDGVLVWKIIYKYNDRGLVSVENEYFGDGNLAEERQFTYTEAGKNDTITYFDANGALTAKDLFRYGSDGVLSEIITYGADNSIRVRMLVKFDSAGNLSKLTTYNVSTKFGSTANEMADMVEYSYSQEASLKTDLYNAK